jgi:hypothetical protein
MLKRNLKKVIKEEGNKITPNVIDKVYESLGISYVQESKKVEAKVKKESKHFVPNVKNNVYASLDITSRSAWVKPLTLSAISTALIAGVTFAIIYPTIKRNNIVPETSETVTPDIVNKITVPSSVNMKVVSASETYSPSVVYSIDTEGQVSMSNVLALNDDASNIINNFDTNFNRDIKQYDVKSFTGKYLSTALNLGYLERQDATKVNKISIEFTFDNKDAQYFDSVIASLKQEIDQFIYENKIITSYTCVTNVESINNVDSEIVSLIRTAYELATKLFVTSEGETVQILCFSTNFEDWIEKYKDSSIEELTDYVNFLKYINEMISDDSMKVHFMDDLVRCSLYQVAISEIEELYEDLLNKYSEVLNFFNEKFNEHRPNFLDPFDGDDWDWWDDYGHNHPHGDQPYDEPYYVSHKPGPGYDEQYTLEEFEVLKEEIKAENFNVNDSMNKQAVENMLQAIEYYADELSLYYISFIEELDHEFDHLISRIDDGEFFDENRPPYDDHYQPEPEGWEDEFEDWWQHHWY